ncbi:MAG: hypothetical protein GY679_01625 [Mycoplasma sp.]|nr:hypothetical protein [Mycoplasma sp.]
MSYNFKKDYQDDIEIRILNATPWQDIRKAALNTIGKRELANKKELTPELLKKYLISEHSPIRAVTLEITFKGMYSPTSVHFCRHVHSIPFVTTSREDRTGKERGLDTPVDHMAQWNLQALIDMMRKRLCVGSCSRDTYNWALSLKLKLMKSEDEYLKTIGEILVPNCIYRGGCPEFKPCKHWQLGLTYSPIGQKEYRASCISERYEIYNKKILSCIIDKVYYQGWEKDDERRVRKNI